jgi:hypothetical protein
MHLGAMEASDKATAQMKKLRDRSRKASRRRPAWQTRYAPGWRRPSTMSARPSWSRRTS